MFRVVSLGTLAAIVGASGAAVAAQGQSRQANLKVSASIVGNCIVTTTDVAFGNYDPVGANAAAPLDAAGTVVLTCTRGIIAELGMDTGQNPQGRVRQMAGSGVSRLPYELYMDVARIVRWGGALVLPAAASTAPLTLNVYGRITQGQDVPVGAYADTVVVTVRF